MLFKANMYLAQMLVGPTTYLERPLVSAKTLT